MHNKTYIIIVTNFFLISEKYKKYNTTIPITPINVFNKSITNLYLGKLINIALDWNIAIKKTHHSAISVVKAAALKPYLGINIRFNTMFIKPPINVLNNILDSFLCGNKILLLIIVDKRVGRIANDKIHNATLLSK